MTDNQTKGSNDTSVEPAGGDATRDSISEWFTSAIGFLSRHDAYTLIKGCLKRSWDKQQLSGDEKSDRGEAVTESDFLDAAFVDKGQELHHVTPEEEVTDLEPESPAEAPTITPEDAKQTAYEFLDRSETAYDLVLTDLPGTVNAAGVFRSLVNMDYLFVPVTQNRMVMQSSMNFVLAIRELLSRNDSFPLKDIRLFWNCMDRRVSKELYRAYTEIFRHLKLKTLETVLPKAERFNRGICTDGQVFRSTLFPPSPSLLKGSHIDLLADELETILGLTD